MAIKQIQTLAEDQTLPGMGVSKSRDPKQQHQSHTMCPNLKTEYQAQERQSRS